MKPNYCSCCKTGVKGIVGHHLSYEPEVVVFLCWRCHNLLHQMARTERSILQQFMDWVEEYGDKWINPRGKGKNLLNYDKKFKSEYHKKWYSITENRERKKTQSRERYRNNKEKWIEYNARSATKRKEQRRIKKYEIQNSLFPIINSGISNFTQ